MRNDLSPYFLSVIILFIAHVSLHSQPNRGLKSAEATEEFGAYAINLSEQLQVFSDGIVNGEYRISLCADVPNDRKPFKVAHNQECGHVFLILQKINGRDTLNTVFGFYPRHGLPVLLFKTIRSQIKDNSKRDYDVEVTKELTATEFDRVLARSAILAAHSYHINKFNCYDYAVDVFNSIAGSDPIPVSYMRYPFIFGKGGSPCSVYKDLKNLKESKSVWAPCIRFGKLVAPVSTGRTNERTNRKRNLGGASGHAQSGF